MSAVLGLVAGLGAVLVMQAVSAPLRVRMRLHRPRRAPIPVQVWPDAVDDLVASVVAGISLPQAFSHIATAGPSRARAHFAGAVRVQEETGDFAAALAELRRAASDPIADSFCAALGLAHQVGGRDLGRVLRGLSTVLREDIRVRGELEARQSWTVSGARIAIAAPWLTVLVLCTRDDAAAVYRSAAGVKLLVGCAVVTAIAYAAMRRIGRLPEAARL